MANQFANLSEEELIEALNAGDLEEDEFKELIAAMETKGLSGSIMKVDGGSGEMEAVKGYIEYHNKIKTIWSPVEISEFKNNLLSAMADSETKKKALVSLAHVAQPDVYEVLKQYCQAPDQELIVWSQLALQECRGFLEANILEEGKINVAALK